MRDQWRNIFWGIWCRKNDLLCLKLFFGIDRKYPMNLGDISDLMGISRERVRQIKDRGLDMLRMASKKMEVDFSLN